MTTNDVASCQRCPLRAGCNQVVGGQGPFTSKLVLVGLAPGREEDIEGGPFVGSYNRLLEKVLTEAGILANIVYKTYLVKCYSPPTRIASKSINECKFWLWKELALIKPRVVVPLGRMPTKVLLNQKSDFSFLQSVGKHHSVGYMESIVAPWYGIDTILKESKSMRQETVAFFSELGKLIS